MSQTAGCPSLGGSSCSGADAAAAVGVPNIDEAAGEELPKAFHIGLGLPAHPEVLRRVIAAEADPAAAQAMLLFRIGRESHRCKQQADPSRTKSGSDGSDGILRNLVWTATVPM